LPLPVPSAGRRRPLTHVLDQHGGDGHLHVGWRFAGAQRRSLALAGRASPFREGLDVIVLGHGDLVDSDAAGLGLLASLATALPPPLRPRLLGSCLPARDVYRLHSRNAPRIWPAVSGRDSSGLRVDRARSLGRDRRRSGPLPREGPLALDLMGA